MDPGTQIQLDMESEAPPRSDLTKCEVKGCDNWTKITGSDREACYQCRRYNRMSKVGWKS